MSRLSEWLFGWSDERRKKETEIARMQCLDAVQMETDRYAESMSRFSAEFSAIVADFRDQGYSDRIFSHFADCLFRCHSEWLRNRNALAEAEGRFETEMEAASEKSLNLFLRMLLKLSKILDWFCRRKKI